MNHRLCVHSVSDTICKWTELERTTHQNVYIAYSILMTIKTTHAHSSISSNQYLKQFYCDCFWFKQYNNINDSRLRRTRAWYKFAYFLWSIFLYLAFCVSLIINFAPILDSDNFMVPWDWDNSCTGRRICSRYHGLFVILTVNGNYADIPGK